MVVGIKIWALILLIVKSTIAMKMGGQQWEGKEGGGTRVPEWENLPSRVSWTYTSSFSEGLASVDSKAGTHGIPGFRVFRWGVLIMSSGIGLALGAVFTWTHRVHFSPMFRILLLILIASDPTYSMNEPPRQPSREGSSSTPQRSLGRGRSTLSITDDCDSPISLGYHQGTTWMTPQQFHHDQGEDIHGPQNQGPTLSPEDFITGASPEFLARAPLFPGVIPSNTFVTGMPPPYIPPGPNYQSPPVINSFVTNSSPEFVTQVPPCLTGPFTNAFVPETSPGFIPPTPMYWNTVPGASLPDVNPSSFGGPVFNPYLGFPLSTLSPDGTMTHPSNPMNLFCQWPEPQGGQLLAELATAPPQDHPEVRYFSAPLATTSTPDHEEETMRFGGSSSAPMPTTSEIPVALASYANVAGVPIQLERSLVAAASSASVASIAHDAFRTVAEAYSTANFCQQWNPRIGLPRVSLPPSMTPRIMAPRMSLPPPLITSVRLPQMSFPPPMQPVNFRPPWMEPTGAPMIRSNGTPSVPTFGPAFTFEGNTIPRTRPLTWFTVPRPHGEDEEFLTPAIPPAFQLRPVSWLVPLPPPITGENTTGINEDAEIQELTGLVQPGSVLSEGTEIPSEQFPLPQNSSPLPPPPADFREWRPFDPAAEDNWMDVVWDFAALGLNRDPFARDDSPPPGAGGSGCASHI